MRSTVFDPRYERVGRPWVLAGLLVIAALSTWPALGLRPTSYDQGLLGLLGLAIVIAFRKIDQRPAYPYLVVLVTTATLGHMGLLLGLAADFGPAGLLTLASWCSGVGDSGAVRMFAVAPWGHVGMLVGCNAGMLIAGCGRLARREGTMSGPAFLLLCSLGMIGGMAAFSGLTEWPPGLGLLGIAGITVAEMSFGMIAGMVAVWWWVQHRAEPRGGPVAVAAGREKE